MLDLGNRRFAHRLERPELALIGPNDIFAALQGRLNRSRTFRPYRARLHPSRQVVNLLLFQLGHGRHFKTLVRLPYGLYENAAVGIAGHNHHSVFAAAEHMFARVELKAAHLGIAVARIAILGEDGADACLEKLRITFGRSSSQRGSNREPKPDCEKRSGTAARHQRHTDHY